MSNQRTILLIDYDPKSIRSTIEPLEKAGFKVEVANDGTSGLEAFDRLKPDLVLIEPMVPKKHGFQVCQEIKATAGGRQTPVLITTGFYRGRKHRSEAQRNYGCDDYLEKPISEELLLSTCRRFLIDTQEPPIPVGNQVSEEAVSVAPDPESDVAGPSGADKESTEASTKETRAPVLAALDDLSEEEIQARLDALIIEEPEGETEDQPMMQPEPLRAVEFEPPAAIDTEAAQTEAGPLPESADLPPLEAESSPVPEIVFETEALPAEDDLVPEPVVGEADAWNIAPLPTAIEADFATGRESSKEAEEADDREEPRPVAIQAASHAGARRSVSAALPEIEPESRSRLPMWIGLAAVLSIAVGAGMLWVLRDGGQTASFPRPASRTATAPPPRESLPAPARVEAIAPATTGVEEVGLGASIDDDGAVSEAKDAEGEPIETNAATILPPLVSKARDSERDSSTSAQTPSPVDRKSVRRSEPVEKTPAEPPPVVSASGGRTEGTEDAEGADASTGTVAGEQPETTADTAPAPAATEQESGEASKPAEPEGAMIEGLSPAGPAEADPVPFVPPDPAPVEPRASLGDLVELADVDAAPVPSNKPAPDYPASARSLRQQGTVVLHLLVDEKGRVEQVEVDSGIKSKALQGAASRAAKRWLYEPATKDGVPVKVWITEAVTFKL
jgi:TonB family protein